MKYQNTITGVIVDVPSEMKGNWKKIGVEPKKAPAVSIPAPVKAEEPIEEVKPDKPKRKTTRKTKK